MLGPGKQVQSCVLLMVKPVKFLKLRYIVVKVISVDAVEATESSIRRVTGIYDNEQRGRNKGVE